jgi:hypothetical protein
MVGPIWGPSFVEKGVLKMNNNPTPSPNRFRRWYIIMRRILTRGPNITLMNITDMLLPQEKIKPACMRGF